MAASLSPRLLTRYGDPAREIVATADTEDADLIIMATHGMTGWRHSIFGSVAQKVIQHTDKDVLLAHTGRNKGQKTAMAAAREDVAESDLALDAPCIQPA